MSETEGLRLPVPQPARLPRQASAVAVLDVSPECEDPQAPSNPLLKRLGGFLHRAREHGVPVIYTVSLMNKGTELGMVAPSLGRRDDEPVFFPDGFDKFTGGELEGFLRARGVRNLVVTGRATNVAVMYTATAAARVHRLQVVVPVDGVAANIPFEQNYALHQLNALPKAVIVPIIFSTLDRIAFA